MSNNERNKNMYTSENSHPNEKNTKHVYNSEVPSILDNYGKKKNSKKYEIKENSLLK